MNAHHKRAYKPALPGSISYMSDGDIRTSSAVFAPAKPSAGLTSHERLFRAVQRVPFGWELSATLPSSPSPSATSSPTASTSALPVELQELISSSGQFYHARSVNLADLLEPTFMNSYIRQGSLIALSISADDGADVACIDGHGRLILSVNKDTYELLGLPGRPSAFGPLGQRFMVEILLRAPEFKAGRPGFERTKSLLRNWPASTDLFAQIVLPPPHAASLNPHKFQMLFAYVSDAGIPTPIVFPATLQPHVTLCKPTPSTHTLSHVSLPSLDGLQATWPAKFRFHEREIPWNTSGKGSWAPMSEEELEGREQLREWLGSVAIGATLEDESEDTSKQVWGDVVHLRWNGFFHPKVLRTVLDLMMQHLKPDSEHPFFSLALRPHPQSPLSHLASSAIAPACADGPDVEKRRRKQLAPSRKRSNGKTIKRGRATGEEEESGRDGQEPGWEILVRSVREESLPDVVLEWVCWEGQ